MIILVVFEILKKNLDNQLWLLPLAVVDIIALPVLLLVNCLVVPQRSDRLNQLLLSRDPGRALLAQDRGEPHRPELDLGFLLGVGWVRRLDAKLHQLVGANNKG